MWDIRLTKDSQVSILERDGDRFSVHASEDALLLFLGGAPLNEPIAGYGPFVMNTKAEIEQAIVDYQDGKMGQIAQVADSR